MTARRDDTSASPPTTTWFTFYSHREQREYYYDPVSGRTTWVAPTEQDDSAVVSRLPGSPVDDPEDGQGFFRRRIVPVITRPKVAFAMFSLNLILMLIWLQIDILKQDNNHAPSSPMKATNAREVPLSPLAPFSTKSPPIHKGTVNVIPIMEKDEVEEPSLSSDEDSDLSFVQETTEANDKHDDEEESFDSDIKTPEPAMVETVSDLSDVVEKDFTEETTVSDDDEEEEDVAFESSSVVPDMTMDIPVVATDEQDKVIDTTPEIHEQPMEEPLVEQISKSDDDRETVDGEEEESSKGLNESTGEDANASVMYAVGDNGDVSDDPEHSERTTEFASSSEVDSDAVAAGSESSSVHAGVDSDEDVVSETMTEIDDDIESEYVDRAGLDAGEETVAVGAEPSLDKGDVDEIAGVHDDQEIRSIETLGRDIQDDADTREKEVIENDVEDSEIESVEFGSVETEVEVTAEDNIQEELEPSESDDQQVVLDEVAGELSKGITMALQESQIVLAKVVEEASTAGYPIELEPNELGPILQPFKVDDDDTEASRVPACYFPLASVFWERCRRKNAFQE